MNIREHATRLIHADIDMLCRQRRLNGIPYPQEIRHEDERGIHRRVKQQLKDSEKYSSAQLLAFVLFSLAKLIIAIIDARNKQTHETWGTVPNEKRVQW